MSNMQHASCTLYMDLILKMDVTWKDGSDIHLQGPARPVLLLAPGLGIRPWLPGWCFLFCLSFYLDFIFVFAFDTWLSGWCFFATFFVICFCFCI